MKIFVYSINDATFFGNDDDDIYTISEEIARILSISRSDVYVEEVEKIDEGDAE